jgi:hypothetical protein
MATESDLSDIDDDAGSTTSSHSRSSSRRKHTIGLIYYSDGNLIMSRDVFGIEVKSFTAEEAFKKLSDPETRKTGLACEAIWVEDKKKYPAKIVRLISKCLILPFCSNIKFVFSRTFTFSIFCSRALIIYFYFAQ